jgi:hypothetical protein
MFRTDDGDQASSTPPSWSHNDGVQVRGGANHVIDGNNIVMRFSTHTGNYVPGVTPPAGQDWRNCHNILAQSAQSAVTGLVISRNWFSYGAIGIQFTTTAPGSATLSGNRVTPNQSQEFGQYRQFLIDDTSYWTVAGVGTTVYSDDPDTPIAWRGQLIKPVVASGNLRYWAYNASGPTP